MNLKKTNTTLLTLVGLLLILAILDLIKILFSDSKGFEWGSLTDWISASTSIITLIFAFFVYSNWQKEKYRDDTYLIQKQIITVHYPRIFNSIETLEFKLNNYKFRINGHNHHLKDSVIETMQSYLIDTATELEVTSQLIENEFKVMRLFRSKPNPEFEKISLGLIKITELLIQSIRSIIALLSGLKMSEFEHIRRKMYVSFNSMIPFVIQQLKLADTAKKYIFSNNSDLRKLFINF